MLASQVVLVSFFLFHSFICIKLNLYQHDFTKALNSISTNLIFLTLYYGYSYFTELTALLHTPQLLELITKFLQITSEKIIQTLKRAILLIIPNGEGWHYLAVKKLSALLKENVRNLLKNCSHTPSAIMFGQRAFFFYHKTCFLRKTLFYLLYYNAFFKDLVLLK